MPAIRPILFTLHQPIRLVVSPASLYLPRLAGAIAGQPQPVRPRLSPPRRPCYPDNGGQLMRRQENSGPDNTAVTDLTPVEHIKGLRI